MSDRFTQAKGRKVISRSSAQEVGTLSDFLLDPGCRSIEALIVGRGRKARLIDWAQVTGFGPDAVVVADDASLRESANDRESSACHGKLDLIGKRSLTETGNELGHLDDVMFDPDNGSLLTLVVGRRDIPAGSLLGFGSYAAVFSADSEIASG